MATTNTPLVNFGRLTEIEQSKVRSTYDEIQTQQEHALDPSDQEFLNGTLEAYETIFGKESLTSLDYSVDGNHESVVSTPTSNLLEILFCATRYCIGRHSYVSAYAGDIWNMIEGNLDKFNHKRLAFFASDIRAEISERISRYISQFTVEGAYNHTIVKDAHELLCQYLQEHPDTDIKRTKFHIDCRECTVKTEPYEPKPNDYAISSFSPLPDHDLAAWSRLADRIDDILKMTEK